MLAKNKVIEILPNLLEKWEKESKTRKLWHAGWISSLEAKTWRMSGMEFFKLIEINE